MKINSDSPQKERKQWFDLNTLLKDQQLVITSPTFSTGVNYDPTDEHLQFDYVFLFAGDGSVTARTAYQMTMRARHLKSNKVFALLPQLVLPKNYLPEKEADIINILNTQQQTLKDTIMLHHFEAFLLVFEDSEGRDSLNLDDIATDLFVQNALERVASKNHFTLLFLEMWKQSAGRIFIRSQAQSTVLSETKKKKQISKQLKEELNRKRNNALLTADDTASMIPFDQQNEMSKLQDEKRTLKYHFRIPLGADDDPQLALVIEFGWNKYDLEKIDNSINLLTLSRGRSCLEATFATFNEPSCIVAGSLSKGILSPNLFLYLAKICDIGNNLDEIFQTLVTDGVSYAAEDSFSQPDYQEWINNNNLLIQSTFHHHDRCQQKKPWTKMRTLRLFQKIIEKYLGLKLMQGTRKTTNKQRKTVRITTFHLCLERFHLWRQVVTLRAWKMDRGEVAQFLKKYSTI
jgi:hypothetical protein